MQYKSTKEAEDKITAEEKSSVETAITVGLKQWLKKMIMMTSKPSSKR